MAKHRCAGSHSSGFCTKAARNIPHHAEAKHIKMPCLAQILIGGSGYVPTVTVDLQALVGVQVISACKCA